MPSTESRTARRIGMAVCLGVLALVVFALLAREPAAADRMFVLIRWPLWALAIAVPPLVLYRMVARRRRGGPGPHADGR